MTKPSLVILLIEDDLHKQLIFRYLRRLGLGTHQIRIRKSPSGVGSAELWVREQFANEVEALRIRHAETKLIVLIDADILTVQQRIRQLDSALREARVILIKPTEAIARLVPKRNIETWILNLNEVSVSEDKNYKRRRTNWTELIPTASETLYVWARPKAALPSSCVASLKLGIRELRKLKL